MNTDKLGLPYLIQERGVDKENLIDYVCDMWANGVMEIDPELIYKMINKPNFLNIQNYLNAVKREIVEGYVHCNTSALSDDAEQKEVDLLISELPR